MARLALVVLATAMAACAGGGGPAADDVGGDDAPPACGADADARFEDVFATFASNVDALGLPGGAIAVVCGGDTIYARGHGQTRRTGGSPITEHTRFQLASNTKMLTAITAVKLAEDGVVALDVPVSSLAPEVNDQAPFAAPFTLDNLLSHTSGIA